MAARLFVINYSRIYAPSQTVCSVETNGLLFLHYVIMSVSLAWNCPSCDPFFRWERKMKNVKKKTTTAVYSSRTLYCCDGTPINARLKLRQNCRVIKWSYYTRRESLTDYVGSHTEAVSPVAISLSNKAIYRLRAKQIHLLKGPLILEKHDIR